MKAQCEAHGLIFDVVESIPVSEDIKLGTEKRDAHIDVYCENIPPLRKIRDQMHHLQLYACI